MEITKIKRIANSNRYHVYVDDQWNGIFLDETLAKNHLKSGMEVEKNFWEAIKKENDEKVCFDMAVSYLEKYVTTQKGLEVYLKKKNFQNSTIKQTIKKLEDYEILDDEKFAKNYFETFSARLGKRAIERKLKQKGVKSEIIETILSEVNEDDEIEKATQLAEKFVKNRENSPKIKQKCLAHLIYKGYDYSVAQKAVNNVLSYEGENDDWS